MKNIYVVILLLFGLIGTANAGITYSVRFEDSAYDVQPTSTVELKVFMDEVFDGDVTTGASLLGNAGTMGLELASLSASQSGTGSGLFNVAATAASGFTPQTATTDTLVLFATDPINAPVRGSLSADGRTRTVELGSFFFQAGAIGETNTVSLNDLNPTTPFDFVIGLTSIDGSIGFGSATVTAVPEPSAVFLVSAGFCLSCLRRSRRG